jgi:hypothetical protein
VPPRIATTTATQRRAEHYDSYPQMATGLPTEYGASLFVWLQNAMLGEMREMKAK